jgi:hypothetical protein
VRNIDVPIQASASPGSDFGWGGSVIFSVVRVTVSVGLSYLALHFLLYACVLRDRPIFQSERGIFLYHFVSAVLFTSATLAVGIARFSDAAMAASIALIAVHGIYSLSFLELWSLAQGSYSISILTGIASQGPVPRSRLIDVFARIGDAKKGDRLSVLSDSSLAHRDGGHWRLSARGRLLGNLLNALLWLAAIKKSG